MEPVDKTNPKQKQEIKNHKKQLEAIKVSKLHSTPSTAPSPLFFSLQPRWGKKKSLILILCARGYKLPWYIFLYIFITTKELETY